MSVVTMIKEAEKSTERTLSIMDMDEGDFKITWDPDERDQVDMAEAAFDKAKTKGMAAFSVSKKGEKGKKINKFDPEAEAIIMAPALVGG